MMVLERFFSATLHKLNGFFNKEEEDKPKVRANTQTVTFYSYKGGVGRTLALRYLSKFIKRNAEEKICIIDFDLEAPGASVKFSSKNDGVVDYLGSREVFGNFNTYVQKCDDNIDIVSAGKGLFGAEYFDEAFNVTAKNFSGYKNGKEEISTFVQSIKNSGRYNYIFIDSRAGITPLSLLSTIGLSDIVVLFIVPNDESILGSRFLYDMIFKVARDSKDEPPLIIPTLSRTPTQPC